MRDDDPLAGIPDDFTVTQVQIAMAILESRLLCWTVGVSVGAIRALPHEPALCAEALSNAIAGRADLQAAVRLAGLIVGRLRVVKRGTSGAASAQPLSEVP